MSVCELRLSSSARRLLFIPAALFAGTVGAQNLLTNPSFDLDFHGWTGAGTGSMRVWSSGSPSAGSLRLEALTGTAVTVSQCVSIAAPATIDFGARSYTFSSYGEGSDNPITVHFFPQAGCAGTSLGSATPGTVTFEPPENWAFRRTVGLALPAGTQSARMDVTATGGTGQMIVGFDQVTLGPAGAWSCAVWPTPLTLPAGAVGSAYSQALSGNGGSAPYSFALAAGTLPAGIALSADGVLSGMPTAGGSFPITVRATGTEPACSGERNYVLGIAGGPAPVATANFQGLWWAAPAGAESGWGINFAHQGDIIFATWFTYDAAGKPWWLIAELHKSADGVYTGPVSTVTGPPFDAVPFAPAAVETVVGSMTATFADAAYGSITYTVSGTTQTKSIVPQAFGPLPTCVWGAQPNLELATNYTDLWWNAGESGWGVNFTHQGDIIFATWFTYDAAGKPWWLIAELRKSAAGVYSGPVATVAGPPFDRLPFPPGGTPGGAMETAVGNATVTFANGNAASFAYTVNGVAQVKAVARQVFAPPGTACS